ncbi:hypothetical protein LSM04_007998 [Trypanosoma melophagium]|uniref:uncharacterized protein n=1 Tax=Trypanosoma melophagium TaxID=715481 RepID=UPI00351AA689|nr:hypothetical protein LSM04_007998 [Trypanosoma melophagium]
MFLMILLACCRCCVPCLPLSLSCVYWIFGVVYSLLGVVVILVAYLASVGCGEVQLQYQRQPGVFQWYLVPFCNEMFNFETINTEVREAEKTVAPLSPAVKTSLNLINVRILAQWQKSWKQLL